VVFDVALPMHYSEISTLTEQQAVSLAQQHWRYDSLAVNQPVISRRLSINTDSHSVDLLFIVRESQKKKKTEASPVTRPSQADAAVGS